MFKIPPLFTFFVLFSFTVSAQTNTTILKEKSLIKGQTIYLNSKARIGGKNRIVIPVQLPAGTVAWYYSFTTVATDNASQKVQSSGLEMQIAKLITNGVLDLIGAGLVTNVAAQLIKPTGSGAVDVYLTDAAGLKQFEKKDLVGMYSYDVPVFYKEGTAQNSRNGVFQIPVVRRDLSLCLRNPSVTEGVAVSVDVVAIVATKQYSDAWSVKNTESIFNDCFSLFSIKDSIGQGICDCAKNKIVTIYRPSAYTNLASADKERIQIVTIENCAKQLAQSGLFDRNERIRNLQDKMNGQIITKDFDGQVLSGGELLLLNEKTAVVYSQLVFTELCVRQFDQAKRNLTTGLGKDPKDLHLLVNLGYFYLLTGKSDQANEIFRTHKGERFPDSQKLKDVVEEDLKEFERLGMKNDQFDEVRKVLKIR